MRLLLVEDELELSLAILEALRAEAYAVDHATTGEQASELAGVNDYDLILLDWSIPPPTGIELLRAWRGTGSTTPVLMLTGHAEVERRVDGLDAGADDYLTKPFSIRELLARIRSLLRRRGRPLKSALRADDVELDRAGHQVTVAGRAIDLSPKEFGLLEYLLLHPGEVISRSDLTEHVWDDSFDSFSNVVDVTVHRLRKKIDGDRSAKLLETIKGVGYRLRTERA